MKTNDLIEELRALDPAGECEVCVGNHPVIFPDRMPWWYDGSLEYIERDENNKPAVVGYKADSPDKIKLHCDTIEDALLDNPEAVLEIGGITYQGMVLDRYYETLLHWVEEGRKYQAWWAEAKDAKANGQPISWGIEQTWKQKLAGVLKRVGLIDYD